MNEWSIENKQCKMSYGDTIYLLPLFIRKFIEVLNIPKSDFFDDVTKHLIKRLENSFRRLVSISQTVVEGSRRELTALTQLYKTVKVDSGGRLLDVLCKLEAIIESLERYPYLNAQDIQHLTSILGSYENLIVETNYSGLENRTLSRLLKCDAKPKVKKYGVQIVIEVLAGYLDNKDKRHYLFSEILTNTDSVKATFFSYMGMSVEFNSLDYVAERILKLKACSPGEYLDSLNEIENMISMYFQATLTEADPNANLNPEKEVAIWEDDIIFHSKAMEFINQMSLNEIIKADVRDNAALYWSAIDRAHKLFVRESRKRDNMKKDDATYYSLLHELVLHSLHCEDHIHTSLCNSFIQWLQE